MNLTKLYDMQRELDKKIIEEKGLQDMDRLPYLILALQVELGECANEWRGFKYWSNDREPRTHKLGYIHEEGRHGPTLCSRNPLLEEYVDCLHFILSIGLLLFPKKKYWDKDIDLPYEDYANSSELAVVMQFKNVFSWTFDLPVFKHEYDKLFYSFYKLGRRLGFTWTEIEQAYFEKNKINHVRQESGY